MFLKSVFRVFHKLFKIDPKSGRQKLMISQRNPMCLQLQKKRRFEPILFTQPTKNQSNFFCVLLQGSLVGRLAQWSKKRQHPIVVFSTIFRQEVPIDEDLAIIALPAQHWANRWPWDRNTTCLGRVRVGLELVGSKTDGGLHEP